LVPNAKDQQTMHHIIYSELVHGIIKQESRSQLKEIISKSIKEGVQGVILGCTEISLLLRPVDVSIAYFDTTAIHARAAVNFALN
jgi:aspartate racemase